MKVICKGQGATAGITIVELNGSCPSCGARLNGMIYDASPYWDSLNGFFVVSPCSCRVKEHEDTMMMRPFRYKPGVEHSITEDKAVAEFIQYVKKYMEMDMIIKIKE